MDIIQHLITACGILDDVHGRRDDVLTVAYDPIGSYPTENGVVRVGQLSIVTRQALLVGPGLAKSKSMKQFMEGG